MSQLLSRINALTFDDKKRVVGVVVAYLGSPTDAYPVRVFDARTNKAIGSFTQLAGLQLE